MDLKCMDKHSLSTWYFTFYQKVLTFGWGGKVLIWNLFCKPVTQMTCWDLLKLCPIFDFKQKISSVGSHMYRGLVLDAAASGSSPGLGPFAPCWLCQIMSCSFIVAMPIFSRSITPLVLKSVQLDWKPVSLYSLFFVNAHCSEGCDNTHFTITKLHTVNKQACGVTESLELCHLIRIQKQ